MPRPDSFWYSHIPARPATTVPDQTRICRVPGCTRKHCFLLFDGRKVYSRYCIRHTCQKPVSAANGYHCPIAKEDGERYCDQDLRCGAPNCREQGEYSDDEPILPWFCRAHRCTELLCKAGIHDLLQKRCIRHVKCGVPACSNQPDQSLHSNFCSRHTCTYKVLGDDCPYQAVENNRCSEHKKCSLRDCDRVCYKREGEDDFQDKCILHFNRCPRPGCGQRRRDDSPYCYEHACREEKCPEERDLAGCLYCRLHRCTVPNCLSSRRHDGTRFCLTHSCKAPSCFRQCKGVTNFCEEHLCRKDKCLRQGAEGVRSLCEAHKCKVNGCRGEARFENGFCAISHACVEADCRKARLRVPEDNDIERCLDHEKVRWRAVGRRVAMDELRADFDSEREDLRLQNLELEARVSVLKEQLEREQQQRRELENRLQRRDSTTWSPGRRFSVRDADPGRWGSAWEPPGRSGGDWYSRGDGL
ncbi:hypothetical protein B0H66DRAFT_215686 [Apodospora peruviana]|uniref:Uncharacterized protein n=1 Tax=Apodospora peruviana TaxID=516989 RepID=A0AAE0IEK0_9PEZI|nr:hypothetical protein B0H66DRAFT_215686 [Apodospora peruviana]